jgi:hypothetical protein
MAQPKQERRKSLGKLNEVLGFRWKNLHLFFSFEGLKKCCA